MRGMSLIEVLVWIGVTLLILVGILLAIADIYKSNFYTLERALAVASAQRGLEEATRIIREVSYSDSGAYPIVALGPDTLTVYADVDNDGSAERVRIFLSDNTLQEGVIEPSGTPAEYTGTETVKTVVHDVRNIALGRQLFTYYDANGDVVTNMSAVLEPVFVEVDLVANTDRNPRVVDYELRGNAFIRNLKN